MENKSLTRFLKILFRIFDRPFSHKNLKSCFSHKCDAIVGRYDNEDKLVP